MYTSSLGPKTSRRSHIVNEWMKPAVFLLGGTLFGSWLTGRSDQHHNLSLSIVQSDNGVEAKYTYVSPEITALTGQLPQLLSAAIQATEFAYTALLRNSGDFPENGLIAAVSFHGLNSEQYPISGPSLDASTTLLKEAIMMGRLSDAKAVMLSVERLNPTEWFSISTTWAHPVEMLVEARSNSVSARQDQ